MTHDSAPNSITLCRPPSSLRHWASTCVVSQSNHQRHEKKMSPIVAQPSRRSRRPTGSGPSIVEKIVMVFLIGFCINVINVKMLMNSFYSQYNELTEMMVSNSTIPAIDGSVQKPEDTIISHDTAIAITTSWIPSLPTTYMVEMVVIQLNSSRASHPPHLLLSQ